MRSIKGGFDDPDWLLRERDWVRRARAGDREAFGELYQAFAEPLYARVLMPRLGHRQAAEEALAETFQTALERLHQFDDRGTSIWHWLARIAANKAMDQHRARTRTGRALASFEDLMAPLIQPAEIDLDGDRVKLRATVDAALGRIHPRYRRALELRYLQDQPREACAAELGVTVPTFDVILLRALRALRAAWTEEDS